MRIRVPTGIAILFCIYEIMRKNNASYCYVTRPKIQSLLSKIYKLDRCLSDISYHLTKWRKAGILCVEEQFSTKPDGTHYNIASNRWFSKVGLNFLISLGKRVFSGLYNHVFKGIKLPRRKHKHLTPKNYKITSRLPRRSAGPPEILKNVVFDTVATLK